MGYELYYKGRIAFARPVCLSSSDEDRLPGLTRFFAPMFEPASDTPTGRHVTGFRVDENRAQCSKTWIWSDDLVDIEEFAQRHHVTLDSQLRWQGDGCPPDPADDRGRVVFDIHGAHHLVPDSETGQAVEAHHQRCCTCYDPATHPTLTPSPVPATVPVGPLIPIHSGGLSDYTAHCTEHGQLVFTGDKGLARTLRRDHIARHHS
ncbi:hypothetical protein [Streptomyces sp. NRRL F-5053]|uniref:hypothetical protein n=1 Tax=Streptomyces sp. NRRL F-5053 TaxID=1463854 RepID=UPI0004C9A5EC|nr:hypothetical protein [Streptomyces sp. NRRL F-5053]